MVVPKKLESELNMPLSSIDDFGSRYLCGLCSIERGNNILRLVGCSVTEIVQKTSLDALQSDVAAAKNAEVAAKAFVGEGRHEWKRLGSLSKGLVLSACEAWCGCHICITLKDDDSVFQVLEPEWRWRILGVATHH